MSRIDKRFVQLRESGEGALVCFLTAGDPSLEVTKQLVLEMEKAGADIVEIGIPFSDPVADGPSIQAASMRALERGVNIPAVLGLVRSIREDSEIPIVLMTYYNPILHYGLSRFAGDAARSGVDGVITTDLSPDEAGAWKAAADDAGLNTIFLLAPTSTEPRIDLVARMGSGFIYCVSRTGVTGARPQMAEGVQELVDAIRAHTDLPVCVGFGISNPDHVREVCGYADGAVVGSALVDRISSDVRPEALLDDVRSLVSALKAGTKRV